MADISKITLPSGTTYFLKDAEARSQISALSSAVHFIGVTTTALSNGATTNPITIDSKQVTAVNGDLVIYNSLELIFSGSDNKWHELGSTGTLKALAFKASASGNFTPSGSVSQPTFTGTEATISVKHKPAGSVTIGTGTGTANYTPGGSVSTPTITVTPNTTTVNSITGVGSLPSWTASVESETLTIAWSAGSLPTKGSNTTVATGIKSATSSQPTFTGTAVQLTGSFSGTEATVSTKYTPAGSVSQPTFTGTQGSVSVP